MKVFIKHYWVFILMLVVFVFVIAFNVNATSSASSEKLDNFRLIKSPLTGFCYETYSFTRTENGIQNIDCSIYDRWIAEKEGKD